MSSKTEDSKSATEQVAYDLDALANSEYIAEISTSVIRESARVQEAVAPVTSSIASMFAGLQKSGVFASSLQAATKAITAQIAPSIQSIQPFAEMARSVAKAQNSFAKQLFESLDIAKKICQQFQESIMPLKKLMSPIQSLQKGWFGNIAKNIGSGITSVLSAAGNLSPPLWLNPIANIAGFIKERLMNTLQPIFEAIRSFRPFEFARKFFEFIYYLLHRVVVNAATGDKEATDTLARMWRRSKSRFELVQRLGGTDCSPEDSEMQFKAAIQLACYEYLYVHNDMKRNPLFTHYRAKRYFINSLRQQHRELSRQCRSAGSIPLITINNEQYMFTEIAAAVAGRTPQAIRDWIKNKELPAVRHQYASFMAGQLIDAYIIPYTEETLAILKDGPRARRAKEKGLISAQDLLIELKISRMYLKRCEDNKLVIPTRIGRFKYYTKEDRIKLLGLLTETTSPKLTSLVPEFKAQLAYYTAI